jgi:ADP-ribose pyrophosphatase YjhB (NUDIX family)
VKVTHTIGVFASLFDTDGRIILVRQSYAGKCWAQPGGRLEARENPVEGLLREIFEETGVRARIESYIGTYASPYRDDLLLHFRASVLGSEANRGASRATSGPQVTG